MKWDIHLRSFLLTNLNYYFLRCVTELLERVLGVLCATTLEFFMTGFVRFTCFDVCTRDPEFVVVRRRFDLFVAFVVLRFTARVVLFTDLFEPWFTE